MEDIKHETKDAKEGLKREVDSVDDFEHLEHDSSPLKDLKNNTADLLGLNLDAAMHARPADAKIDSTGVGVTVGEILLDQPLAPQKMDSNLLQMGDAFPDRKEADDKLDKFLQEMAAPLKQEVPKHHADDIKSFMDNERDILSKPLEKDQLERYSDSDADSDDFKPSKYDEDVPKKQELPESFGSVENLKEKTFKDVEEPQPEPPKKDYPLPSAPEEPKKPEPAKIPEVVPEKKTEPEPPVAPLKKEEKPEPVKQVEKKVEKTEEEKKVIEAEALFRKMGLDAWFTPEKLHPTVESLIYWRDPKKSGPVFGGVLVALLALTYFSFISVAAYLSLAVLTGTIAFRIYRNVVQAVQKTGDGHPFKDLLELDLSLPQDKVKEVSEVAVAHVNAAVVELRRLFLVEDLVDSIKFGVLLWTLTYLGAWFNGMTLIILGWVALFSLPKVYETNKTQIDANLEIVRTKLAEITSKVKAAIPIGKKPEEKKEQ